MTYCCGNLVREGLVMMADTCTNAGLDNISTAPYSSAAPANGSWRSPPPAISPSPSRYPTPERGVETLETGESAKR